MDADLTLSAAPSSFASRQPSRTKRPKSSGSQTSVISTGSAADKYLEYVPRISSPLTLPPIEPPPSDHGHGLQRPTSWSPLGISGLPSVLETAMQGGRTHRNAASESGAASKEKKRSRLSSSTFLASFPVGRKGRKADAGAGNDGEHAAVVLSCTAVEKEDPGLPLPSPRYRRLQASDEGVPGSSSNDDSWGRSTYRWSQSPQASTSRVTLAQLLAEEFEQIASLEVDAIEGGLTRTSVNAVDVVEEEERRPEMKEDASASTQKAKRHRKQKSSVSTAIHPSSLRQVKEEKGSCTSTDAIDAGCLPCSIDVRRTIRSWLVRMKVSKREAEIPPALQALVERPMSPEEYHAYFLSLYINANEQNSRPDGGNQGREPV